MISVASIILMGRRGRCFRRPIHQAGSGHASTVCMMLYTTPGPTLQLVYSFTCVRSILSSLVFVLVAVRSSLMVRFWRIEEGCRVMNC